MEALSMWFLIVRCRWTKKRAATEWSKLLRRDAAAARSCLLTLDDFPIL